MYINGKYVKPTSKSTNANPWLTLVLTIIIMLILSPIIWLFNRNKK